MCSDAAYVIHTHGISFTSGSRRTGIPVTAAVREQQRVVLLNVTLLNCSEWLVPL